MEEFLSSRRKLSFLQEMTFLYTLQILGLRMDSVISNHIEQIKFPPQDFFIICLQPFVQCCCI